MFSKNGVGVAVMLVEGLLTAFGVDFEAGSIAKWVEGTIYVGGLILMLWHQVERTDTYALIFKK